MWGPDAVGGGRGQPDAARCHGQQGAAGLAAPPAVRRLHVLLPESQSHDVQIKMSTMLFL